MNNDQVQVTGPLVRSVLFVSKMDCPSEENLIRMAFDKVTDLERLTFDLNSRTVAVDHRGDPERLVEALRPLSLGAQLTGSSPVTEDRAGLEQNCFESTLSIPKMDCPSEENLIRMALADVHSVQALDFDLSGRKLRVTHVGDAGVIVNKLGPLGLGASLLETSVASGSPKAPHDVAGDAAEARTLRLLLGINGIMFLVEMTWGLIAQSTGLIADSLDMFADAAVYGLALYAVGRAAALKTRAAHVAGWLQLALALGALGEVLRRAVYGSEPESSLMMGIGTLALVANVTCLMLIAKKRDRGAHMKASYIFSANDVIANLGVIIAGALVTWTGSPYPDFVVGFVIGVIVLLGARRILKLR